MALEDDILAIGAVLDRFAAQYHRWHVAAEEGDDGVPPDMQAGPINAEGWVEWRLLPSTLTIAAVIELERRFGVEFPPGFHAYLLARHHFYEQVASRRHSQSITLPVLSTVEPLAPLHEQLMSWQPLITAGYIPFAEFGDSWGPICFDADNRLADGDCPVVWMDHEPLITLGPAKCGERHALEPFVQPLYGSFRGLLGDVFAAE